MKTFIKAKRAITGNGREVIEDVGVLVNKNRIEVIDRGENFKDIQVNKVYDLKNYTILPGLIDLHVHLALNGETSFEVMMLKELVSFQTAKAVSYLKKDLENGITTIRAVGDKGFLDVGLKKAVNQGYITGPRLSVSGHMLTITGGRDAFIPGVEFSSSMFTMFDGPHEAAKATRYQLKYGVDWIKVAVTGAVTAGDGVPGAQQPTLEELKAIVECANLYGTKVAGHAHGAEGIKAAATAGFNTIEHGMLMNDDAAEAMAKNNTALVPTLLPVHSIVEHGVESGIPKQIVERAKQGMEKHLQSFEKALEYGITIGMGTDTGMPFVFHGKNAKEVELMVRAGLNEHDAILSATLNAAKILGWENEIGSLEKGKLADVIAVKDNPINNISTLKDVVFVMKDGVVYKDKTSN